MKKALTVLMSFVLFLAGGVFLSSCDLFNKNQSKALLNLAKDQNVSWELNNYAVTGTYNYDNENTYSVDSMVSTQNDDIELMMTITNAQTSESETLYMRDNEVYFIQSDHKYHLNIDDYLDFYNTFFLSYVGIGKQYNSGEQLAEYETVTDLVKALREAILNSSRDIKVEEVEASLPTQIFNIRTSNNGVPLLYALTFENNVLQKLVIENASNQMVIERMVEKPDLIDLSQYEDLNVKDTWQVVKILANSQTNMQKFIYQAKLTEESSEAHVSYDNDSLSFKLDITHNTNGEIETLYLKENKIYFTENQTNYFLDVDTFIQKRGDFSEYLPFSLNDIETVLNKFPFASSIEKDQVKELDFSIPSSSELQIEQTEEDTTITAVNKEEGETAVRYFVGYVLEWVTNEKTDGTSYKCTRSTADIEMPDFSDYVEYTI